MPQDLQKRTAIVELFKSGKTASDIAKTLNINRMMVWRTLKRFESTGDIVNQPGQGRPRSARTPKLLKSTREKLRRNPRRSLRNLAKEAGVSTILHTDLQTSLYKRKFVFKFYRETSVKSRTYLTSLLACFLTWFSVMKKFDIQQHVNIQNDRICSRKGEVKSQMVTQMQGVASVMV